tara:strand:+ start:557 stop:2098 length:1542 start_codon:yes stop_codon:yes gene_type:complete
MSHESSTTAVGIPFNGQDYIFQVGLVNGDTVFPIPTPIITEVLIQDSLYSIFSEVVIVFNNTGNVIDHYVKDENVKDFVLGTTYQANTESKDVISLKITPVDSMNPDAFPEHKFLIEGLYSVVDEDEIIIDGDSASKYKMLVLKDVRENYLENTYLQWSTTQVAGLMFKDRVNLSHTTNAGRQVNTGIGMYNLLNKAIPKELFQPGVWDKGRNKVFYTSPVDSCAFDDLEFLLDRHISEDGDNCILKSRNYEMNLAPVGEYFDSVNFHGEGRVGEIFSFPSLGRPVETGHEGEYNLSVIPGYTVPSHILADLTTANNFSILNISNGQSNNELVTPVVHGYNNGVFFEDHKFNNIINVKKIYQQRYVDKLPKVKNKTQKAVLPLSEEKINNKMVKHYYCSQPTQRERLKFGINKVLHKILALGPTMNLESPGDTERRPGRFALSGMINIDPRSPLAKLLLGEWMFTKVDHLFVLNQGAYINTIVCNKAHTYEEIISENKIELYDKYYEQLRESS